MEEKFNLESFNFGSNGGILKMPGDHIHTTIETAELGKVELDRKITEKRRLDVIKVETESTKESQVCYPTTRTVVTHRIQKNKK